MNVLDKRNRNCHTILLVNGILIILMGLFCTLILLSRPVPWYQHLFGPGTVVVGFLFIWWRKAFTTDWTPPPDAR